MALPATQPSQATDHVHRSLTETPSPYERLAENHIRLLEILHDAGDEQTISCRLTSRPLESDVRYVALSYTWGRQDPDCHVLLNEREISVRKNLKRFLHEVRTWPRYEHTLFWIDAVCINQADFQERSEQVKLMADIYQRAERVLVWLGPAYANSDLAMKALARDARYWQGQMKMERVFWKAEGAGIRGLCERPYWTRLWVFQELVQARTAVVICGSKCISWKAFVDFCDLAETCSPTSRAESFEHVAFKRSPALSMVRRIQQAAEDDSALFDLILASRQLTCSEPRDKVYALLGVARSGQHSIKPDYSVSVLQLMNSVLRGHHLTRPPRTIKEVSMQCRDLSEITGVDVTALNDPSNRNKPRDLKVPGNAQPQLPLLAPESDVSLRWIDHYDHVMVRELWLVGHTQKDMDGILLAAIAAGEVAAVRMLLNLGGYNNIPARVNLNCAGEAGERPLVEAARLGRAEIVKLLLEHDRDLITQIDRDGYNAMYHAIVEGQEHVVKRLISHPGVNINGKCAPTIRVPLLHLAIQYNRLSIVRLLLAKPGINPGMTYDYSTTNPIKQAIYQRSLPIVKLLLSHSSDFSCSNTTPLHLAIAIGDTDIFEYIFSKNIISPNAKDNKGRPPLFTAIANWRVNFATVLLSHPSISVNAVDNEGNTALHMAIRHRNEHIQDLLVSHPELDFNIENRKGRTALRDAVAYGNERVQEAALGSGKVDVGGLDRIEVMMLGERAWRILQGEAERQGQGTYCRRL